MRSVRYTDGIRIDLASGDTIAADASQPDGEHTFLSHAHGDHLYDEPPAEILASELTLRLATARREETAPPTRVSHPSIELLPSGHIPGSRALYVEDAEQSILYTGDVSTRERFYFDGFDPVDADILIIESTYGKPEYRFPPQDELENTIIDWLQDTQDVPLLLFGYSLGRAQEIELLVDRAGRSNVYVTRAISKLNAVIESMVDVEFGVEEYGEDTDLAAGDVLILPSQTNRLSFVDKLKRDTDAVTAGFSGWAADSSFIYQRDFDEGFILSDHCDFDELVDIVRGTDPEKVYVQHGFADEFASHLTSEYGFDAQALRQNQRTLGDF